MILLIAMFFLNGISLKHGVDDIKDFVSFRRIDGVK